MIIDVSKEERPDKFWNVESETKVRHIHEPRHFLKIISEFDFLPPHPYTVDLNT